MPDELVPMLASDGIAILVPLLESDSEAAEYLYLALFFSYFECNSAKTAVLLG